MTVAAIMLVKDEADIINAVLDHLHTQVDEVVVYDNMSTDGTREILEERGELWFEDSVVGYHQDRKTTAAALEARKRGHNWILPCDADEIWYAPDGRSVSEFLDGITPDVRVVKGQLFNHLPSGLDDVAEPNPMKRIGWRQKSHGALPKVCVRMENDMKIGMGNHSAHFDGHGLQVPGLILRHFSWRSPEQYLKKIRNGSAAYAATTMDEQVGAHWRMFNGAPDQAVIDHFWKWFFIEDPVSDRSLIFDPAPILSPMYPELPFDPKER